MEHPLLQSKAKPSDDVISCIVTTPEELSQKIDLLSAAQQEWMDRMMGKIQGDVGILLPPLEGQRVAFAVADPRQSYTAWAKLADMLPPAVYEISPDSSDVWKQNGPALWRGVMGWVLGQYRFVRYKTNPDLKLKRLVWPSILLDQKSEILSLVHAVAWTRDLINTPAQDMGPQDLEHQLEQLAKTHHAHLTVIQGKKLEDDFPLVYAVGKASVHAPRLLDLTWGDPKNPKLTLVGKGVCFDSGGLDIKPPAFMQTMKKDMGGAACVMGLGRAIMEQKWPVFLRVVVPAVENSVSGNAFRPLDIIRSRKSITVEVGDTDAEGRLILADALAFASEHKPDFILDCATLTGAARVAMGRDIPPFYTNQPAWATRFSSAGEMAQEFLWQMPLYKPYRRLLDSALADISNITPDGMGGSITAALFLQEFVDPSVDWAHFDLFCYNTTAKPGHPQGGEATAFTSMYLALRERFGVISGGF